MALLEVYLGNALGDSGEYDDSIVYFEKCRQKWIELHGEKHEEVATSYNNIGSAYAFKGEYDKAIQYYEKAIDILKDFLSENHPDMQTILRNYKHVKKLAEGGGDNEELRMKNDELRMTIADC